MAAKKTNYISYDLKKLRKYIKDVEKYLDEHPVDEIQDRLDVRTSQRGNPIVKVIASEEQQLKAHMDALAKLPLYLEAYNNLCQSAQGKDLAIEVRGGGDKPAFMDEDEDEDDIEDNPLSEEEETDEIDFEEVKEEKQKKSKIKKLPAPSKTDEGTDGEEYDNEEEKDFEDP